ncbi:MAG TPA: hypothetical protein VM689_24210 [Aliidongia sp.]|nr:hypothetical protein [Aliidongia sp.]
MKVRSLVLAAASVLPLIGAAQADTLKPIQGRDIDLGAVSGVAYYTVEKGGYHVVATLGEGEAGTPVRFEAMLVPGQSVVLSTPRAAGVEPVSVEISRQNDDLVVRNKAALTH